jgi:hypothetical protein
LRRNNPASAHVRAQAAAGKNGKKKSELTKVGSLFSAVPVERRY